MQLNTNGDIWSCSFLFGLYKEKIFRIYQIKDAYKLIVSEVFKIIGLILLLYPSHFIFFISSPTVIRFELFNNGWSRYFYY